MASDQGGGVDVFDVEKTFQFSHFQFPWPVKVSMKVYIFALLI